MRPESSHNFICITMAVLALATALPRQHETRIARSGWLFGATCPQSKAQHHVFGDLAAVVDIFYIDVTAQGKTEELAAGAVRRNFFRMIGVEPVMGRAFRSGEGAGDRVVILSYGLWQRRFGGAASAVGRSIILGGEPYRVIGILPADFIWNNRETDVWVPLASESGGSAASYTRQARLGFQGHELGREPEI